MKKIFLILICFTFFLVGCSPKEVKPDAFADNFVPEGKMTVIRYLISSNAYLVENVFIENRLPFDAEKSITNTEGTFAPVVSDKYETYTDLYDELQATYTDEAAERILAEYNIYSEVDGKLYINTSATAKKADNLDWSNPEIEVKSVSDGIYELKVTVKTESGRNRKLDVKAVTVDGNIRLEDICY